MLKWDSGAPMGRASESVNSLLIVAATENLLKGVIQGDEARRAVDAGVSAISVSNHGGNNLDDTLATIHALPLIAEAVGDQVEVFLDGGVRRGSDVVQALVLGPRALPAGLDLRTAALAEPAAVPGTRWPKRATSKG